jgi:hypothetical protein
VVKHLPHHPYVKGFSPVIAAAPIRDEIMRGVLFKYDYQLKHSGREVAT